jgi:phage/plasmid-associated DNA primase
MGYKLYIVKSYALAASEFDDNMEEFTLEDAIDQLENSDSWFHFRIHSRTQYIFFGDLDNYPKSIDNFIDLLHQFLKDKYNLEFDKENDFKYTKNDGKAGSYHYSIPKWNLSTEKLKEIHSEFLKTYPNEFIVKNNKKETYCVDTTIYSEHWFRCPNQTKGNSNNNSSHKIIFGNMADFIVEHIPKNSININNCQLITNPITLIPITTITSSIPHTTLPSTTPVNNQNTNSSLSSISSLPITTTHLPIIPTPHIEMQETLLSTEISKSGIYKKLFDECFAPIRFNDYQNWIKVGMAIKNTIINPEEALQLYIYFSSKGASYEGVEPTTRKYNSFTVKYDGYGVGTIYKMAIEDNKNNAIRILSTTKLQFQSTDICRFIKAMVGHRFFYKKENNNYTLYCYNGKYWETNDVLLRSFISGELYELLKDMLITVFWNSRDFQSYKSKLDKLNNLTFKREIIETYKEYNSRTDIDFDSKWWLLGFTNKVYDMEKCQFREYEYDDYISITTGYDWHEPNEIEIKTINSFINTIMPIKDERDAFLQILATGIDGRCIEKFIIFNGYGGNGKGVINDIMLKMLGSYGLIGNNNLLFEKSKMGSNPEKANLHKKRYVVFREPSEKNKFENSVVKELTGGGKFSARGHYESETQKELCNTTVCETNVKIQFADAITKGDIRRVIDLLFRSSFTDIDSEINPQHHIFKANPDYKTVQFQEKHRYALFKILSEHHRIFYHENGSNLKMPESIMRRTDQYLENSSDVVSWFQFEYKQNEPLEDISFLPIAQIHNDFKNSDTYCHLSKSEKDKYTKVKFFDFIKTNIFFKKYYVERYGQTRHLIKGWCKADYDFDL